MIAVNRQPVNGTMGPTDKPIMDMINDPESYPLSLTFGKYVKHCDELLSDILLVSTGLYALLFNLSPCYYMS